MSEALGAGTARDPLATWPDFAATVRKRLTMGQIEYGDRSFRLPLEELMGEIEEELADVCGWAFVLWCRVCALRETLRKVKVPGA